MTAPKRPRTKKTTKTTKPKKATAKTKTPSLRERAEHMLARQQEHLRELSTADLKKLVHELGTHQIELELQNEELHRMQAELEASRNNYVDLYDFAPIGYCTVDRGGLIQEVNITAAKLLGIERSSLIHKPFSTYVEKEARSAYRMHCSAVLKSRIKQAIEIRLKGRGLPGFYALLESVAVEDIAGKVVAIRTTVSDISSRKQAEEALKKANETLELRVVERTAALQESEERFRLLVKSVKDYAIFMLDPAGRVTTWNEGAERLKGYKAEEIIGKQFSIFYTAEDAANGKPRHELSVASAEGRFDEEGWRVRKDGSQFWASVLITPVRDDAGTLLGFTKVARDITGRMRAEKALRASEEQFRALADSIPNLAWWANGDGYITWYNQRWYEYTGTTPEQMEGWGWQSVHDSEALPKVLERWTASITTGEPFEMEFPLRGADGVFRTFLTRVMPLKDSAGRVVRWFGTNTDVSALKQVEEALRQNEEKYRTLFTSVSEGFTLNQVLYDESGKLYDLRVLEANPAAERANDLTRDKFVGKTWRELWPGAEDYWWDICNKVMLNNEEARFENYARVHDRWYEVHHFKAGTDLMGSIFTDVTERKRSDEALQASESRFCSLFETMAEGFSLDEIILDEAGKPVDLRYLSVNPAFERHTGLKAGDIIGRTTRELFPDSEPIWFERYGKVVLTGEPAHFEERFGPLNKWFEVSVYRTEPGRFAVVFFDISERKQNEESIKRQMEELRASREALLASEKTLRDSRRAALNLMEDALTTRNLAEESNAKLMQENVERKRVEAALKENEERLRLFIEHAPASLAMFDRDMRYLSVSRRWLSDYGLGDRDLQGLSHYDIFPEIPERWKAIHRRALAGEVVREESDRFVRADGSIQWLRWEVHPWYDTAGGIAGIVVFSEDITASKQAEEVLRESENQFRTLADSIPNLAWWANGDGYITWYNQRWYEYTGTTPEQMEGWGWQSVHDPEVLPKVMDRWRASLATGQPFDMEFPLRRADGVFRSFLTRVFPLKDSSGLVQRWFGTNTDVSSLKHAEEALQQTNAELAVINSELENFSYTVSHDLRTPLRAIEGFTTAIIDDYGASLNDAALGYFDRVVSASKRMSQLIDAMLNMARLTKGEMQAKTVDLSRIAELAVHDLRKRDPGRTVDFVIAPGLKARCDSGMLTTVMENLLDNAWKFTSRHPAARIEFGAFENNGQTVYFVRDDGAGFDMQFASTLFLPFKRFHADAEFPGLGIGLAIVHSIIVRHHGRIWAESEKEKGTTVFFTLS